MIPTAPAPTLHDYYLLLRRQLTPAARTQLDRRRESDLPAVVGEALAALYHPERGSTDEY